MSRMTSDTVRVIPIRCPRCHGGMNGALSDRLFFCSGCDIAVDFRENPPCMIPVIYVKPPEMDEENLIWLPVWRVEVDVLIESDDMEILRRLSACRPDRIWIFAMILLRTNILGNAHLEFSRLKPVLEISTKSRTVSGCQIRRNEAVKMSESVVAGWIDKEHDITDLTVITHARSVHLHALPFEIHDNAIVNPNTGFSINRTSVTFSDRLNDLKNKGY